MTWEYLLAHHFPGRYCRTLVLRVGGRTWHFCARCTGQVVGFLAILSVFLAIPSFEPFLITPLGGVLLAACPSLALADWLTQTVRGRESNNGLRVLSGLLLGVSFGGLVAYGISLHWLFFVAGLVALAAYLLVASVTLFRTGAWRRVVAEHFP